MLVFVVHGLFHLLADDLGQGYENALGVVFGPGPRGAIAHAAEFVVVLGALFAALTDPREQRRPPPGASR